MKYPNTAFLKDQFTRDGAGVFLEMADFTIDDIEFAKHLADIQKTSKEFPEVQRDRAAYRCLTFNQAKSQEARLPSSDPKLQMLLSQVQQLIAVEQESSNQAIESHARLRTDVFDSFGDVLKALQSAEADKVLSSHAISKETVDLKNRITDVGLTQSFKSDALAADIESRCAAFQKTYTRDKRILIATGIVLFLIEIFTN